MSSTITHSDPLLRHDEAAEYLRMPPRTLYQRNWRGDGPRRIRTGRAVLYRQSDLDAWLEIHVVEAPSTD
jgi:predicted DNA-binding transcriptional regulator AlpA